jgi:phytol kinase
MIPAFLQPFVPEPRLVAWLLPVAFLYGAAAAAIAAHLKVARGVRTPYTRKIFHFLIFTAAGAIQMVWGLPAVVIFGSVTSVIVLFAVWRGDGFPFYEAMARPSDAPRRTLFILIPLVTTALGGVVSNLVFPAYAFAGYLVCGWGDAAGEPVGTRWGRHRYRVPSMGGVPATRSLEGSAAVFGAGAAATLAALLLSGMPAQPALAIAVGAGAAGALVEAVSTHGLDNFTVQVAASAAAQFIAGVVL